MDRKFFKKIGYVLFGGIMALTSCVNNGGQVFGELPPGVQLVTGTTPEARSAVFDEGLNELKITWKVAPNPDVYKGVEVSFQTLSGGNKTVKMFVNPNFASTYDGFTVVTNKPESVTYRCLWDKGDKEEVSEWASVSDLALRKVPATSHFSTMKYPTFKFVTEANVSEQAKDTYYGIVGKDEQSQEEYYSNILVTVLSSLYYSTDDAGTQPVKWLKCILGPMDFDGAVAYVSGDSDGPLMRMSAQYLDQIASGAISGPEATFEIRGVLLHEFVHLVQATGAVNSNQPSCIEGMADAVRTACGGVTAQARISTALNAGPYYDENRKSGNTPCPYVWQLPYGTSGYFMAWLRYYDGDFLRKLTVTIKSMGSEWSLEKAVHYILGEQFDIKQLWEEYIEDVRKENA